MVRLTWHEAVVRDKRLIIRWPVEEKRLRTLLFVPWFVIAGGLLLAMIQLTAHPEWRGEIMQGGLTLLVGAFLYGCFSIWFRRLWVLDKERNALLAGGWKKVADLNELTRFTVKREKRGRDIVFVLFAERENGDTEQLGLMDQEDADELGRELARFTRRPYSSR